jgi:beta-N-acetylhexosaminidase
VSDPARIDGLSLEQICGQLIVGGFSGQALPATFARELSAGRRGGAILFKRNVGDVDAVAALTRSIALAAVDDLPPLIAIDQEGGRVVRLGAPFLEVPPMCVLGERDDLVLTAAVAEQMGKELRAAGFNMDFAPVMDVDSNPDNPVIGDRAFGRDPRTVMTHGVAFVRGLQQAGVLACAKHFPGHGDTELDSHLELPTVRHDEDRLRRIELPPFRAASGAGVAAMMSAHVVYPALEPDVPATMSRAICTSLLRTEIGFEGVLFSDDLEMGAVAKHHAIERIAVEAVWAGCDALLICKSEEKQSRAHEVLVKRAESDSFFRARCEQAARRCLRIRRLRPPRVDGLALAALGTGSALDIAKRLAALREAAS